MGRRNIYISNCKVNAILDGSCNVSKLIEEAILHLDFAVKNELIEQREIERLLDQGLLSREIYQWKNRGF